MCEDDLYKDTVEMLLMFPKRVNKVLRVMIHKNLKDTRLKANHLIIIRSIGCSEGMSQRELAATVPFDKSYISTTVHDLIDMGFVCNDGDGKVHSLRLTDAGRDIWGLSNIMLDDFGRRFAEVLTEEDRVALSTAMTKINGYLDQVIEEGAER